MSKRLMPFLASTVLLGLLWGALGVETAVQATSHIIYVNHAATGGDDGTTWEHAYTDLQDALGEATAEDEIWVATGVYTPGATVSDTFALVPGVAMYGGFAGGETARDQRDWEVNPTVLSGDIGGDDTTDPHGVVITTGHIVGDNSYHVVTADGTTGTPITTTTVLDGFIITAGYANGLGDFGAAGGGLHCYATGLGSECSPAIANTIFTGNRAHDAGAMFNFGENYGNSSPTLTNVRFLKNSADFVGAMFNLGYLNGTSSPILTNVIFSENSADREDNVPHLGGYAGAMRNAASEGGTSSPILTDVIFVKNTAHTVGGAMLNQSGDGGISNPHLTNVVFLSNTAVYTGGAVINYNFGGINTIHQPSFENVIFIGNSAEDGGAMVNSSINDQHLDQHHNPILNNVSFFGNHASRNGGAILNIVGNGGMLTPRLTNVTLAGNYAGENGGAIFNIVDYGGMLTPHFTNVTLAGNYAGENGGAIYNSFYDSWDIGTIDIAIQNSIVWNNEDGSGVGTAESSIYHADAAFTATFSHTLVQGCNPSGAWVASCGTDGGNNLADVDPLFIDTPNPSTAPHANGNVRLLAGSPAIDAGDNSANSTAVDLDGHGRIQNGVIDLGAYETATAVCPPSGLLYVNHSATGNNAGTSWADAYTNLQSALTFLSEPCEIWVATGIYTPGATVSDTFALVPGVAMYGGFAGGETARDQRDWEANPTVLSGDIGGDDTTDPHGVVITTGHIVGDNSYHVVTADGSTGTPITTTTVLDGFIITAGYANGVVWFDFVGGGLYCHADGLHSECSPTIANTTFSGNRAHDAGAMFNFGENYGNSSPTLTNVRFLKNSADFIGAMFNLGYLNGISSPTLTNVIFSENSADRENNVPHLGGYAGAMRNAASEGGTSSPILTDVIFVKNTAHTLGGAMLNQSGDGGISNPQFTNVVFLSNTAVYTGGAVVNYNFGGMNTIHQPSFENVIFIGNSAEDGGAMVNSSINDQHHNPILNNVSFLGNHANRNGGAILNIVGSGGMLTPHLTNVTLAGNYAGENGGAIHNSLDEEPWNTGTNVTLAGNYAGENGGAIHNSLDEEPWNTGTIDITIQNSIVWNNEDSSGIGTAESSIYHADAAFTATFSHTIVQGCNPSGVWVASCGTDGGNNLADVDPLFVETPNPSTAPHANGNVRLLAGSPAIDAGDDSVVAVATDLDGNPRIMGTAVDLGAYEFFTLPPITYTLNLHTIGEGTVTADPAQTSYTAGQVVTLTATADPNHTFTGWSGAVTGTTNPITLTMNSDKVVTATFTADTPPPITYTLNLHTIGEGTLTAEPAQTSYTAGQVVTLTATADPNHTFTGWSGDVTGTTNPITLTMDSDKVVTATFVLDTHELTILKTGTGNGSVVSIPAGIACGASCTAAFSHGTLITLTATADTGSTFTGWSGPLTSTNPTITVTLEMAMTLTAEFALEPTPPTSYRIFLPLVVK